MLRIVQECGDCGGKGNFSFQHSLSGNPATAVTISEYDCDICSGTGKIIINEVINLYENIIKILEDYPDAEYQTVEVQFRV